MDRPRARGRTQRRPRAVQAAGLNVRYAALASIPLAFAAGSVAARLLLRHAPAAVRPDLAQPLPVVTAWGDYGAACFAVLAAVVAWSTLAALIAMRATSRSTPASLRATPKAPSHIASWFAGPSNEISAVLPATALSLAACCTWPFAFSSDVYAYAAYGEMSLRGLDPYQLVPAGFHDAVVDAARIQWSGTFPVCVYGPAYVGIARFAVATGASHGVAATLGVLRAMACAAFLASVVCLNAALSELSARQRFTALCGYGCNPVLLWSAAEGHNDTFVALAACAAALLWRRKRLLLAVFLLALTPVLKASGAVLAIAAALDAALLARLRAARVLLAFGAGGGVALGIALPPLLPALGTVGTHGKYMPGSLQAVTGMWPAALLAAAAGSYGMRRLSQSRRDGIAWLGIAAVVALPNVYPWYGLWLVPLAVASGGGRAGAALWGATICAVLRYLPDASGQLPDAAARLVAGLGALPLVLAFARRSGSSKKVPFQP